MNLARPSIAIVPPVAVIIVAAVASLALIGWTLDVDWLKGLLHPGHVAMNPATAVGFLLSATSLWALRRSRPMLWPPWIAVLVCQVLVLAIAVNRLGVQFDYWTRRFDTALFVNQLRNNTMAPNTALAFTLLSAAFMTLDARPVKGFRFSQPLLLGTAAVAAVSLVGYLYHETTLYSVRGAIPMALNTAALFLTLSLGTLCARPEREPLATFISPTAGGAVTRRLIPVATAVPLVIGGLVLTGWKRDVFDPTLGMTLFVLAVVLIFGTLVWWSGRVIGRTDSDRRRAAEKLRGQHEQLVTAIAAERAALEQLRLTQSQLVQSEKLASLGQMVAGVAHEINNPLSFVSNNVAVLQRDTQQLCKLIALYARADDGIGRQDPPLMEEIRDLADRMDLAYTQENLATLTARSRDGLRRIQQIVKDLRDFARLDESDLHEVDLNSGIESTVNIVAGRAKKKRVELVLELWPLPQVSCYPAKINQVVMNLVANAIDACPEGGKVRIGTTRENQDVRIAVTDNGPGVPAAIRGKIFDPFFTTKPQGEGTGLGLSISYGIVNDHGGRIEVTDAPGGGGAVFVITIPICPEEKKSNRDEGNKHR